MPGDFKPDSYNSVSPYLVVKGAEDTIRFLKTVLDAQEIRRFPNETGGIMHAEVRIDDTVVMLADSTEQWQAIPACVHVYVPDVDATYEKAMKAGATSIQEPVQKGDADKRGAVQDAGGTTWWIGTKVE